MKIFKTVTALAAAAIVISGGFVPTASAAGDVYTTPGYHQVNGREWNTTCEPYSQTERCRTEIKSGGKWVFNNLTYKPSPRSLWTSNPLGNNGSWTATDGRVWRTECDTAATGQGGCRSYFKKGNSWVFNNIVMFSTSGNSGNTTPGVNVAENCALTVGGVRVNLAASQETITVAKNKGNTSSSYATVTMVKRVPGTACGVTTVFSDSTGRYGYNGTAPAETRKQGSGKTPSGVFTVTEAFGNNANPGTDLSWRNVDADSYWVLDGGAFHNQWRQGRQGGFKTGPSEHLASFGKQYSYAAVINFNRAPVKTWQGGAIFLHVHGSGATGSCVSIQQANMVKYLNNVSSGDSIVIV